MANTLKTLSDGDITREALRIFKNSNAVIGSVNRQYDDRFAKTGAKNGGRGLPSGFSRLGTRIFCGVPTNIGLGSLKCSGAKP